mmetsp:Transcript_20726/g.34289  ORF Transcript_20726/g.34289 Transcript_20726/m.34289 type:complete len:257 (-) Transcript_20726:159-929(-)|eukprot:CAMPEP_0119013708 /NCGR_PEP_ID=MMETSP1176-20130426/8795_1 /TAXON_ID=265551 /ORGANISM="Synedropsis recta cf, Strain CCMP1620" /LENGTH=256 /DNA_ID=CAMNT_0006966817 /DNA_START=98 /DNA_END=868 /DNA_ORIENTATION=-
MARLALCVFLVLSATTTAFQTPSRASKNNQLNNLQQQHGDSTALKATPSRRSFLATGVAFGATAASVGASFPAPANAIGPVKLELKNPTYLAVPCPPDKPIPGEKAMKGLRGLCVTVKADLAEQAPKDLEKVGVYGYVRDGDDSGDSVLANNPDLNSDAGQFAMIESITTKDNKVEFEFIAAIPKERDISGFENGIGQLTFSSLRIVSFPGGQQFGAISPCEMNEFSDECEAWETENGEYTKAEYMVKSNGRTKGR